MQRRQCIDLQVPCHILDERVILYIGCMLAWKTSYRRSREATTTNNRKVNFWKVSEPSILHKFLVAERNVFVSAKDSGELHSSIRKSSSVFLSCDSILFGKTWIEPLILPNTYDVLCLYIIQKILNRTSKFCQILMMSCAFMLFGKTWKNLKIFPNTHDILT
jgi:hypothetical protein